MRVKRSKAFIMRFEARPRLDVGAMLEGRLAVQREEPLVATSLLTGQTSELDAEELKALRSASSQDWVATSELIDGMEVEASAIERLLGLGLLIGDAATPPLFELRRREESLQALQWDDAALLYHITSRHQDLDAGAMVQPPIPAPSEAEEPSNQEAATRAADPVSENSVGRHIGFSTAGVVPFAGATSVVGPGAGSSTPGQGGAEQNAPGQGMPGLGDPTLRDQAQDPSVGAASFQAPGGTAVGGSPVAGLGTHVAPDVAPHLAIATVLGQQMEATVAQFGPPPPHFHHPTGVVSLHDLPEPAHQGPFLDLLRRRRTTRLFDPHESMTLAELSTVLYYTYGCQGFAPLTAGVTGLRKTSPSGGAMHPVEVYPLVLQVESVPPGLYHYNVERHALGLMRPLTMEQGRSLATTFTSGQSYYGTAHVLFMLTARFLRNYWKYRKSQKAYKVLFLDAGHLSQTLYLTATALGLGAFFTGAVNDINIEQALGIDGVHEGVLGISGCGRPRRGGDALAFETQPYLPRLMKV